MHKSNLGHLFSRYYLPASLQKPQTQMLQVDFAVWVRVRRQPEVDDVAVRQAASTLDQGGLCRSDGGKAHYSRWELLTSCMVLGVASGGWAGKELSVGKKVMEEDKANRIDNLGFLFNFLPKKKQQITATLKKTSYCHRNNGSKVGCRETVEWKDTYAPKQEKIVNMWRQSCFEWTSLKENASSMEWIIVKPHSFPACVYPERDEMQSCPDLFEGEREICSSQTRKGHT